MITKNYRELVPISNEIVDALIEGKELPVGSPHAVLKLEKIPGEQWHEQLAFFKAVYNKHKSEAMAYWFYNKETLQWLCDVPLQEVKGASVEVNASRLDFINSYRKAGWDFMMSIHTHGSMAAGQSGQDAKDEHDDTECALHITLGRMDEKYADWNCRAMVVLPAIKDGRPTGEKGIQACVPFCITNLLGIDGYQDDMPGELKTWLVKYHAMEQVTKEFPKEWMERVSEKVYHNQLPPHHAGAYGGLNAGTHGPLPRNACETNQEYWDRVYKQYGKDDRKTVEQYLADAELEEAAELEAEEQSVDKWLKKEEELDKLQEELNRKLGYVIG